MAKTLVAKPYMAASRSDEGLRQKNSNREFGNLSNLNETGATNRVLNLSQIYLTSNSDDDYGRQPFFQNKRLNKGIILIHALRGNDHDRFSRVRRTATKLILPFDHHDLKLGGTTVFINQIGFDSFCRDFFDNQNDRTIDTRLLNLLDGITSLDPFLLSNYLAQNGFNPAACYFKIAPHEVRSMTHFANRAIEPLVRIALGTHAYGTKLPGASCLKLTGKLLSFEQDSDLEPLKLTLKLDDKSFTEGMFSWRAFLYFKWRHHVLKTELNQLIKSIYTYKTSTAIPSYLARSMSQTRASLIKKLLHAYTLLGLTLKDYDDAYLRLIHHADAVTFRDFLLTGPSLFSELGETLSTLSHVSSFWRFRTIKRPDTEALSPTQLYDLILGFEESLSQTDTSPLNTAIPSLNAANTPLESSDNAIDSFEID